MVIFNLLMGKITFNYLLKTNAPFKYYSNILPLTIASVLKSYNDSNDPTKSLKYLEIHGWVRTVRLQKNVAFIEIHDGSQIQGLQLVLDPQLAKDITVSSSISCKGHLIKSIGKEQSLEFLVKEMKIVCLSPSENYPLQKKTHSLEFLRSICHLRARTKYMMSILKIKSAATLALHQVFKENEFVLINTPILTGHDCEGGGEIFEISNKKDDDSGLLFFGKRAYLTVSGQLHLESSAHAFSRVYTFGPAFRAESSHTTRHLAEFWMLEAEMAFMSSLSELLYVIESSIKKVVEKVLLSCKEEFSYLDQHYMSSTNMNSQENHQVMEKYVPIQQRLKDFIDKAFSVITYTQAIELLRNPPLNSSDSSYPPIVKWGQSLGTEHEQYLAKVVFKSPVFITDYPFHERPFYMKANVLQKNNHSDNEDDDQNQLTVANTDLILPDFGEIVGGSLRENDYEALSARMKEFGLNKANELGWYLDLRKYGSVAHGGFGLGFERFIMFLTGTRNIRDVVLMHRTENHLQY